MITFLKIWKNTEKVAGLEKNKTKNYAQKVKLPYKTVY